MKKVAIELKKFRKINSHYKYRRVYLPLLPLPGGEKNCYWQGPEREK